MSHERRRISRRLSHLLRHAPQDYRVELSPDGWASLDAVVDGLRCSGIDVDAGLLEEVVRTSDKQRFELDRERGLVRAVHGHSVPVELGIATEAPPEQLYHGTVERFLPQIAESGLLPRQRQSVHLSETRDQAVAVAQRRGRPVILIVESGRMAAQGHGFRRSTSGVWLVDRVPPEFLVFPDDESS